MAYSIGLPCIGRARLRVELPGVKHAGFCPVWMRFEIVLEL